MSEQITPIRPGDPDDPAGAGEPGPEDQPQDPQDGIAAAPDLPPEAPEAAEPEEDEEVEQQVLDFGDKLTLSLKGKAPTRSQLKIRPVSRDISGQMGDKGDDESYAFVLVGRIHKMEYPYQRDEAGRVIGKIRRHIIDPHDVVKIPDAVYDEVMDIIEAASAPVEQAA